MLGLKPFSTLPPHISFHPHAMQHTIMACYHIVSCI
ncbi:hypothetical protein F383_26401 [Gossypium arboreum]|uniref:Uncharacterized protein n=1 Tax=Gossypium arboreum TaxID=29729 RepID=A0A0B0MNX9_GOSAR|nr:hypothetical protein F383_26401 [Gossypium arboreum]